MEPTHPLRIRCTLPRAASPPHPPRALHPQVQRVEEQFECQRVTHMGEVVWACSVDPVETKLPPQWKGPAEWKREAKAQPQPAVTAEVGGLGKLKAKLKAVLGKLKAALGR